MSRLRLSQFLAAFSALAVIVTLSACGGSSSSSSSASSGGAGSTSSAGSGSTGKTAKGAPIKIGWVNPGTGTGVVFPYATQGAKAAVAYVNNTLGGVDGRPLQLVDCESDGTAEGDTRCGQQVVGQKPMVLSMANDFNLAGIYQALSGTTIPLIGADPDDSIDANSSKDIWLSGGGPGYLIQQGDWIADVLKPKRVVVVYDNPVAAAGLTELTGALKKSGAQISSLLVNASQSDWLGTWQTAAQHDPQLVIGLFGAESSCIGLAQARQSQQSKIPLFTTDTCVGQNVFKAAGTAMDGTIIGTSNTELKTDDPSSQYKIYEAEYSKYTNGKLDAKSPVAFSTIMTIYGALKRLAAKSGASSLSGPALFKYMKSTPGQVFMGGPYNCATHPSAEQAICADNFQDTVIKSPGVLAYAPQGHLYHYSPSGVRRTFAQSQP